MKLSCIRSLVQAVLPVLTILAVGGLLFMPWWKDGKVCAPLDIVTNLYEPWADANKPVEVHNHNSTDNTEHYLLYRDFVQKSLAEEGQVGWNPLKGGGTAEYGNTMASPGDFTYIFYRFLPYWHAWNLGLMVQYMIAMLGMFIFLRHQKYARWLALAGALAYGLNTHFAAWIFHRWALGAFCWTPWFLWSLNGLRNHERIGVLAPLFIAASFIGGQIQYAVFQVFVCVAFTLGWYFDQRKESAKLSIRPLAMMTVIGIVATMLASFTLIPSAYAFHVTMQSGLVRGGLGYPDGIIAIVKRVIAYPTYLFPAFYGTPGSFDLGRVLSTGLIAIPFFGSLFAITSIFGLFVTGLSRTAKTLVTFGLFLPLTPLVGPMYQRLLMLFILGGVWLAVDAISRCSERQCARMAQIAKVLFLAVALGFVVIGVVLMIKHDFVREFLRRQILPQAAAHRFAARPDWFEMRIDKLINALAITHPRIWLSLLGFGFSVFLLPHRNRAFFGPVLTLCVFAQLWIPHKEWMTFVTPPGNSMSRIYPLTEEIRAIQDAVGQNGRVVVAQSKGRLPLFPPNSLTYFGITSLNVYDSFLPNGMEPHNNYNPDLEDLRPATFYSSIGVSLLVTFRDVRPEDPGWALQTTAGKIAIYSNLVVRARYEAFTKTGDKLTIKPDVAQRNFRSLQIPSNAEKLSICENHALGWESRIDDGPWLPLDRAEDGSMSATLTPVGDDRRLEMRYNPPEKRLGRFVSAVGIVFFFGFALFYCRDIRKQRQVLS